MSTLPDNELDLEKLFLPAWAQQPSTVNRYAKYTGGEERDDRRDDRPEHRLTQHDCQRLAPAFLHVWVAQGPIQHSSGQQKRHCTPVGRPRVA